MKAKVIKEFEMYGITHKVGEIMNISLHSPGGLPMISDRDAFLLDNGFIEEIKEPLIKDEKIRNAVRAWAEANGIGGCICKEEIHCITFETERGMFISFENADPIPPEGNFTIAELCGEEEEND